MHNLNILHVSPDFILHSLSSMSVFFVEDICFRIKNLYFEFIFSFELMHTLQEYGIVCAGNFCTDSNESHLMQKPTFISILAFQHYCSLHVFQCSAVVHTIVFNFVLQKSVHYLFQIYVCHCLSVF